MRCKNCAWPNRSTATVCVKCGAPLEAGTDARDSEGAVPPPYSGPATESVPPKGTVIRNDRDVAGEQSVYETSGSDAPAEPAGKPCPKCGYPLRGEVDRCPNCRFELRRRPAPEAAPAGESEDRTVRGTVEGPYRRPERQATRMMDDSEPKGKFGGTVNPFMMDYSNEPACTLEPIQRTGERTKPAECEYRGDTVALNRDNTDPGNMTITSRCQAELVCEDGRWSIVNRSDYPSTFVLASERTPLRDGDVVLLGNRMFRFHC